MVLLGPARVGLKPLPPQPELVGERVQLGGRIGLEVTAAGPPSPIADGEGVIDVDAHSECSASSLGLGRAARDLRQTSERGRDALALALEPAGLSLGDLHVDGDPSAGTGGLELPLEA